MDIPASRGTMRGTTDDLSVDVLVLLGITDALQCSTHGGKAPRLMSVLHEHHAKQQLPSCEWFSPVRLHARRQVQFTPVELPTAV